MSKEETIKDIESWVNNNYPDHEITYIGMESRHVSGQENYAIYDASDDTIIQENDYKNPNSKNHSETEYTVHN